MASRGAPKIGLDPDVAAAIEAMAPQFGGNKTCLTNWLLRQALGLAPETPTIAPVIAPTPAVAPKPALKVVTPLPVAETSDFASLIANA